MTTINQLSAVTALAAGDQIPVFSTANGDARKASLTALLAYIEANFAQPGLTKQTASPTSTGFTVTVAASTEDKIWLVLSPTGAFATGTIVLPVNADTFDGQSVLVTCSQAITTLTVTGTGTINGAPTSLIANSFFEVKYNASVGQWFCVAQAITSIFTDITVNGNVKVNDGAAVVGIASAAKILAFTSTVAAINNVRIGNSITGNPVRVFAEGSDANIGIDLEPKNTGVVRINTDQVVTLAAVQAFENKTINGTNCAVTNYLAITPLTVATLPAASGFLRGARTLVTDSNATLAVGHGNVVAGGGANITPVYCDGTNWRIG